MTSSRSRQLSVVCAGFVILSIAVFLIRQNTVVIDATQLGLSGNLQQHRAAGHPFSNRSYNLMEETELTYGWTQIFNSEEYYLNANKLAQDHPCVIETIRRHYLNQPPSPQVPLKLDSDDISKDESPGQTDVIMKLLKNQPKSVDSGHSHIEGAAKTLQKPGIPGVDPAMITVQCFPFYSVLLAVGQTQINFFSLDVEGNELKILKTIPWHKVDIKCSTAESADDLNENSKVCRRHDSRITQWQRGITRRKKRFV
ncbi:hypothetical protein DAPPUDRAFT_105159 [Daphnia pulex]|uniref:Methyltransferase FkbM domain-containing protein n=1 Tax=Daphnia pulex TaxID=6669 RepID=E9GPP2_DAPPU|nr:hypothetical protein DAPPUDRAFT_105159 [Daphnia pulex]|eukprot:EFX78419.1 hypothetical protein DAPPUDRAFT_105159 [Daphnia pulex]